MKKVLVTGDRNGFNPSRIRAVLNDLKDEGYTVLVHGAAPGVDTQASYFGRELGYEVRPYPADWQTYHRAAGPIRNRHMLVMEMPDLVVAFHPDLSRSKGTANCVALARDMNIQVKEVS